MSAALAFERVSKRYRRGRLRLSDRPGDMLALDDVSFRVREGEAVALVGANGAGKTTLLRLAARVLRPSSGRVTGAAATPLDAFYHGLDPVLPPPDNARFLLRLHGVPRRLAADAVERVRAHAALDDRAWKSPVRALSSGMRVRLGVAIGCRVAGPVILADETLAHLDAEFRDRTVAALLELRREGRALLWAAHDLTVLRHHCERALWLRAGRLVQDGPAEATIGDYERSMG